MAVDRPDPLNRATEAIRDEETPGWTEVSQSVMARVRRLVTPAAMLRTFGDDGRSERGPRGSTVLVSGRVLVPRLRDAVNTSTRAVDSIDVVVGDDDRCTAVRVAIVGTYGSDLNAEGDDVRSAVGDVLRSLLGPDPEFDPAVDISVDVVDVVEGDPHLA